MTQPDAQAQQFSTLDETLWNLHFGSLRHFCCGLVGPADADDIAVAAFLRCREPLTHGEIANPRAYLFRTASNLAQNERRRRSREWARAIRTLSVSPAAGFEDSGSVRDAIALLSPRQRAVLYLAYWEDLTEREIGETLGLHLGTVHRHLHRARISLRKALQ